MGCHTREKLGTSAFPLRVTLVSRDSVLLPIIPVDGRSLCPAPPEPILFKSCSFGCFLPDLPPSPNPDYPFRVEESPSECLTTLLSSPSSTDCSGDIQTTGYIGKGRSCVRGVSNPRPWAASCVIAARRIRALPLHERVHTSPWPPPHAP